MGKGHVLFFMDKGAWLQKRHRALYKVLTGKWGYTIKAIPVLDLSFWPAWAMNDWTPSGRDMAVNRKRIDERK
jgi:hypothetical protein